MNADQLTFFDPLSPEFRANPYPYYDMLRMGAPIFYLGAWNMWFVTRHEDCAVLLRDSRLGQEILNVMTREELGWDALETYPESHQKRARLQAKWMVFRDPPAHTRLRGLVHKAFTPRMVNQLRDKTVSIAQDLLDKAIARGSMDLVKDFAIPLPVTVIAELLGVPLEDQTRFKGWSDALAGTLDIVGNDPELWDRAADASAEFEDYFLKLIAQRRAEPRQDLLTALVQAEQDGDKLSEEELIATAMFLLIAGQETTVNLIGNGMLALLRSPDQLEKLKSNPTLVENAIEEFLRFDSPVQMTTRWVLEDTEYAGNHFRKGQQVAIMFAAANRDPEVFPAPDQLDITRENAGKHLAFGNGIHFCLGAPLARMESRVAFEALIDRLPHLRLVPDAPIEYRKQYILRGLTSLPVAFDAE